VSARHKPQPAQIDVPWTKHRARVASLSRFHPDDIEGLDDARRNLREAKLADYIKKTVDAAPPLTAAQRDRLALLLRGAAA